MPTLERRVVLLRELRARIVNISESGCLLETSRQLDVGSVGTLTLQLGIGEFRDDFEVVRCEDVDPAWPLYHVGVRFLWTTPRHAASIRHGVAAHAAALEPPDTVVLI
jgi:hypothetical protein